ncbi:hypothetical protein [Streptomyces phaeochromogenes]|uniref:hypothetical protein n=1 Tax=Streptomyces phaeochromogenes TaxID=1923 RepID=UPI003404B6F7
MCACALCIGPGLGWWPGSAVEPEIATVSSIRLASPDGTPLPTARAGQYLTLRIPSATGPAPVRSYSLSRVPDADGYRISVKGEPHGTVSGYVTARLRPGAILDVAAPRGDFVLAEGSGPVLLISAGIGLMPVLSMLHELAARRSDREVWWIHGARGPREHPLAAEAHALLASLPNTREQVFYSAATAEQRRRAHAADGRLTKDKLIALSVPADATAYVCGPAPFMADMQQALTTAGVEPSRIHTELFGALPSINPGLTTQSSGPPHLPLGPSGTGPLVTFARSGISTTFPDSSRSVLELAEACDVPARWSCCPATSPTPRPHWIPRPTARRSSAVRGRAPTSSWTCSRPSPRGESRDCRQEEEPCPTYQVSLVGG